jgi:hypothetical protein
MAKIKVKVPHGHTDHGELEAYMRIVHQHLRYAGLVKIPEFYDAEKPIEFVIDVEIPWAQSVVARIRSYGDSAEIVEE